MFRKPSSIALILWVFHLQSARVLELSNLAVGENFSTQVLMQQCLLTLALTYL